MLLWWSELEDGRPGRKLHLPTVHLAGTDAEYVRTKVPIYALAKRWRLVMRDYQQARWQGDLKTTLALEERRGTRR